MYLLLFSWLQSIHSDVGPEAFLGPEVFFSPEILRPEFSEPLPSLIDDAIQCCPIDTRRLLYKNIVLSVSMVMCIPGGEKLYFLLTIYTHTIMYNLRITSQLACTTAQGGSTNFRNLSRRLARDIRIKANARLVPEAQVGSSIDE